MPTIYNCHTHIFTIGCAPDRFLGLSLGKILKNRLATFLLSRILKKLIPSERDFLEKYGNFMKIGREKSQEGVFDVLKDKSAYPKGTRFVVLTLDMDFMGAGDAYIPYLTQIGQVKEAKIKYCHEMLPFISVDPRRGNANEMYHFVKEHIEDSKFFCGIKLYPALGFFPFDERLKEVYKFAQDNSIPIMTHCTKGGIHYRGKEFTNDYTGF